MDIRTSRGRFKGIDEGREAHARGAPALVLLHAFPLSAEAFRADAHALAADAWVVAPSLRGFGGSDPFDGPPTIDAMADDVAALLDALEVPVAVVGGLSMGGYVALAFARRHASRLRGIVLADTRAEADSSEARSARDAAIARVEGGDLAGFVDALLEKLVSPATRAARPEIVERVRAMALASSTAAVADALRALRDRPDATADLAGVGVPALALVGADDVITPPAVAEAMTKRLPRSTLRVLHGAGHLANLEAPEPFRAAVRAFLATV